MTLAIVRFLALLSATLALVPAGAHLAELPHKIGMPAEEYRIVQQIYRGWALFGFVVIPAVVSNLALAIMVRRVPRVATLSLVAFLCIAGTQIVFWTFTFPVNQATQNWTVFPPDWAVLRARWEYSHAASAVLNLTAVIALILSVSGDIDKSARRQAIGSRRIDRAVRQATLALTETTR